MAESDVTPPRKGGFFSTLVHSSTEVTSPAAKVYVYEAPLRAWHWLNALAITVLCVTGYLIGDPLPSVPGEASMNYSFGYVRMIHFGAGQVLALALLYRLIWAFFGNHHAHQLFLPPFWSGKWWHEVAHEIRWYAFFERTPKKYIGHNPLAQLAMFTLFLLPLLNSIVTGFALYAEGAGIDSFWYAAFGWVFSIYGDSFFVHTVHHLSMWVIVCFAIMHIYVAIREDIMSRQSLVSTMISGWRYFKDDRE
ncbi:MAG: Ni/Fe-hydrogenase, b-type cytochrome subunit [Pseudomonadota bacterium]